MGWLTKTYPATAIMLDSLTSLSMLTLLRITFSMLYESDQHRLEYIEDVFEGSSERVTSWKSLSAFSGRININAAENRLLDSMKRCIQPCMQSAAHLVQKPVESLKEADFASVYLNRDWYFLLLDYINGRIESEDEYATPQEFFRCSVFGCCNVSMVQQPPLHSEDNLIGTLQFVILIQIPTWCAWHSTAMH
jgi:hypothetical protein